MSILPNALDLTGMTFGKLTVLHKSDSKNGKTYWTCVCSCENHTIKDVQGVLLKSGKVKSCGCLGSRPKQERHCLNCNKILNKNQTKYCCKDCQTEYEQKVWEEKWFNGEVSGNCNGEWQDVRDRVRNYLFKKYNNKCSICGWGEINPFTGNIPLEVEHIDGNAKNTTPENVTLLCPNCHSLTSTYRGANRGNGRPKTWIPKIE